MNTTSNADAGKNILWPGATPFCPAVCGPNPLLGFGGHARPRCTRFARAFGVLPRTKIRDRTRNLQNNVDLPYREIKSNIADSLNLLIHVERRPGQRLVSEVLEIAGYNPGYVDYAHRVPTRLLPFGRPTGRSRARDFA